MKILLVEPSYRRNAKKITEELVYSSDGNIRYDDDKLWYPPIGLLKLSTFHKLRGDQVEFVMGCNKKAIYDPDQSNIKRKWDRVYVSTLFTFSFKKTVETINFYKDSVCDGDPSKVFVGGIMASLMPDDLFSETGVRPVCGILNSPQQLGLDGDYDIDSLPPDYSILPVNVYAINSTFYAYTSRGCVNSCPWCGVPKIEPRFIPYIDIKKLISSMVEKYGEKPCLKLMDNNVMASPYLDKIVKDLVDLGYSKGQKTKDRRTKYVDFNQGVDASYFTDNRVALLSCLNIKPMRIAFDKASEVDIYNRAIELSVKNGFRKFSNYMLYNCEDTPYDLFFRLMVNIQLNESLQKEDLPGDLVQIYSYPMRFAPIDERYGVHANRDRDKNPPKMFDRSIDWLKDPAWTKRFIRNVEIMKGAAHGAISPTPSLARRTVGNSFEEFLANLYMPEELLRNRNKHEKKIYDYGSSCPKIPGSGYIEEFRDFISSLLKKQDEKFYFFHDSVSSNLKKEVREAMKKTKDKELLFWLNFYS